jgi:two-component sensor histidine kinase
MDHDEPPNAGEELLAMENLAEALGSDRFKQFLDHMPVAVAVSELKRPERIIYTNGEFDRLTDLCGGELIGKLWEDLPGKAVAADLPSLGRAVSQDGDYIGPFAIPHGEATMTVNAWSNIIEDDEGDSAFRLVALAESAAHEASAVDALEEQVREKDMQLRELQHRVKNNLQMITALIRIEAKGVVDQTTSEGFDRLAGRVEALGLLYKALADPGSTDNAIDLGVYLSEIASAVMRAHAVDGLHLDLQVDTWPVSINVAMPTGLVVNELLTNALKHAFVGREDGTITLHCTADGPDCIVTVADDGVGLPEGATWPKPGKLSSLIVRALHSNANARLDFQSRPGKGTRVAIALHGDGQAR